MSNPVLLAGKAGIAEAGPLLLGVALVAGLLAIAVTVFGRGADFDAVLDPIVRVQAGRLRRSLERYYLLGGADGPLRIEMPKGGYTPVFVA